MYLARMIAIPAALLWTTHAFQPPRRRLPRIGQRRLVAPEEASVAVQAYADKAASAIAAAVAGADASLLASTGFTLAQAGIVVAAAALGAAAMRLFNREERKEMKTTRDEAVAKAKELEAVWKSTSVLGYPEKYCVDLRDPPRHRAGAFTGTTSRQWPGNSTPSSRRSYGDNIASNLISTQVGSARPEGGERLF